MRCDGCRWWEYGQETQRTPVGGTTPSQGACTRFGQGIAAMDDTMGRTVDLPGWESARAYIAVADSRSLFVTSGDFGCVQHEAKI